MLDGDDAIRARPDGVKEPVVFCGHGHVPRTIRLPGGRLVVNPGSVGPRVERVQIAYPW